MVRAWSLQARWSILPGRSFAGRLPESVSSLSLRVWIAAQDEPGRRVGCGGWSSLDRLNYTRQWRLTRQDTAHLAWIHCRSPGVDSRKRRRLCRPAFIFYLFPTTTFPLPLDGSYGREGASFSSQEHGHAGVCSGRLDRWSMPVLT